MYDPPELSLTQDEWKEFSHWYLLQLIKNPSIKLGRYFCNYFPLKMEELNMLSHLGGNPGHCASLDAILYTESSNSKARSMIYEWFDFTPEIDYHKL